MESKIKSKLIVKIYEPSIEEFSNFREYVAKIENCGFATKIIPPKKIISRPPRKTVSLNNVLQKAEKVGDGYVILYHRKKKMMFEEFQNQAMALDREIGTRTIEQMEDLCWDNVKSAKSAPLYAIDNPVSLFTRHCSSWNLNKLSEKDSIIHGNEKNTMNGIHTSFAFIGSAFTSFSFHIEDGNLSSISYNHLGKPKIWYVVPGEYGSKLEELVKSCTPSEERCSLFIRHKRTMIPPSVLEKNEIKFARVSTELMNTDSLHFSKMSK